MRRDLFIRKNSTNNSDYQLNSKYEFKKNFYLTHFLDFTKSILWPNWRFQNFFQRAFSLIYSQNSQQPRNISSNPRQVYHSKGISTKWSFFHSHRSSLVKHSLQMEENMAFEIFKGMFLWWRNIQKWWNFKSVQLWGKPRY